MAERRRIRLAAVPYEEEVDARDAGDAGGDTASASSPPKFRRLAYKDEGAYDYSEPSEPSRKAKFAVDSTTRKGNSKRSRRQSRKKSRSFNKTGASAERKDNNLLEELETTTWSLLNVGRKMIEKGIEEGKMQALKAAMRLRKDNDRNYRPRRSGRVNRKRRTNKRSRKLGALDLSSSEESRSINSGSSYGSTSASSHGASSYSDAEPSMSLSASSSKSSKTKRASKKSSESESSKSRLNADGSFDSLGDNSIIADDSCTFEEASPSPSEETSTDRGSSEDDEGSIRSGVSGAWAAIQKIVQTSEAGATDKLDEETTKSSRGAKMEILPEPDSSDSWIQSLQTDSDESFSTALNKELSYHRHTSSSNNSNVMEPIQHRIDEINDISSETGHPRKPTAELSDEEFLNVIRETRNEVDEKQSTTKDSSYTSFLDMIDKPIALEQAAPTSPSSTLSNADFLKAMQQENGVAEEEAGSSPAEPTLSKGIQQTNGAQDDGPSTSSPLPSADFSEAVEQEKGVEEDAEVPPATAPQLSNTDFLKAIQQENGVEEDTDVTPATVPSLSNTDFLKAMQQDNGVKEDAKVPPATAPSLSNTDFLKAMQQENGVEEGAEVPPATAPQLSSTDFLKAIQHENGVEEEAEVPPATAPSLSNIDFLKAMQQENGVEEDAEVTLTTAPSLSNTDFLKAVQQENGVEEDTEVTLATIPQLSNTDFLKATQQKNEVTDEVEATPVTISLLSNSDFIKAMQRENGVRDESETAPASKALSNSDFHKVAQEENAFVVESTETQNLQLMLSDDLSNADFLSAMKESLNATGGKFEQEPAIQLSVEACSVSDVEDDKSTELDHSNSQFLRAMQQTAVIDDGIITGDKGSSSTHATVNENFLSAVKQMGGDTSMFNCGKLETILEVESPSTSPPTSYTLTEEAVVVVMGTNDTRQDSRSSTNDHVQSEVPLVVEEQDEFSHELEQVRHTNTAEALATKPKDIGPSNELPDLKCVSSEESDTHFDPPSGTLEDNRSESEKEDIDDGDTGFMTADDILAEDDTNFFSAGGDTDSQFFSLLTENQGPDIGSNDSLDEILSDRKRVEEQANAEFQEIPSDETQEIDVDEAIMEIGTKSENPVQFDSRMEEIANRDQDTTDEEARCTVEKDGCMKETEIECRQDESSGPLAEASSQDDVEERKALIRAIQVDESLTLEEKTLLIKEIESGVPIDETLSGEVNVPAKEANGPQTGGRDAPAGAEQSRMEINKAIGKKVIQGWTLLDSSCPQCVLPLMTNSEAVEAACIFCDYSRSMNGVHGTKINNLAPPPPPPLTASKKAKKRTTRTMTAKEVVPVDPPSSLMVSE
ncbi:MAG: hypothetical protein SGBAC_004401 [Bacillariaceae sp.]